MSDPTPEASFAVGAAPARLAPARPLPAQFLAPALLGSFAAHAFALLLAGLTPWTARNPPEAHPVAEIPVEFVIESAPARAVSAQNLDRLAPQAVPALEVARPLSAAPEIAAVPQPPPAAVPPELSAAPVAAPQALAALAGASPAMPVAPAALSAAPAAALPAAAPEGAAPTSGPVHAAPTSAAAPPAPAAMTAASPAPVAVAAPPATAALGAAEPLRQAPTPDPTTLPPAAELAPDGLLPLREPAPAPVAALGRTDGQRDALAVLPSPALAPPALATLTPPSAALRPQPLVGVAVAGTSPPAAASAGGVLGVQPVSPPAAPARPSTAATTLAAVVVAPAPAGRSIDPAELVEAVLTGLPCARVQARVVEGTGQVTLAGHVRSEEERRQLTERLAGVPGIEKVGSQGVRVVGEPYCHVLAFLGRPGLARSEKQRAGDEIGPEAQAGVAQFAAGTVLELQMSAPKFASYVYVDYFTADGRVFHLLPGSDAFESRFAADERFQIGARGRGRRAVIAPPFGLDVVVALASSKPLFASARPVSEGAADYLAAISTALGYWASQGEAARVEYAYHLIYTAPAGERRTN